MSKIDKNGNFEISSPSKHLKQGVKDSTFRESNNHTSSFKGIGIFGLIFCFIFVIAFANYLKTGQFSNISFKSFIEFLSSAPNIDISWSLVDLTIYAEWGIFNFLRDFFNWFTNMFEVLISLFGMIVQALAFIFHLVKGLLFY